jgi:hypothetical protein
LESCPPHPCLYETARHQAALAVLARVRQVALNLPPEAGPDTALAEVRRAVAEMQEAAERTQARGPEAVARKMAAVDAAKEVNNFLTVMGRGLLESYL